MTQVHMIEHGDTPAKNLILYLMELRIRIIPPLAANAPIAYQAKVVSLLSNLEQLADHEIAFAEFDWTLQKRMAELAPNPIDLIILNSYNRFYLTIAQQYFQTAERRSTSTLFYKNLLTSALQGDVERAETITRSALEESLAWWKSFEF